jgi:hypothetical protein
MFQILKENNCNPRVVYPAKLFFLIEGEIKTFHNQKKTKGINDYQASTAENLNRTHTEKKTPE